MRLLLFTALFVYAGINAFAQQPTTFGSTLVDGNYASYNLADKGSFRQVRLQATSAGAALSRNWNFAEGTAGSQLFTNNWRPYSGSCNSNPNLQIPGYNQVIAPASGFPAPYASATFNSSIGGCDGFLPAVASNTVYTVNVTENTGDNHMGILATAYTPRTINNVFNPSCASACGAVVTVVLSGVPATGENVYVRYSTDGFVSSALSQVIFPVSVATGTASIPDLGNTTVTYYAFSSPKSLADLNSAAATHGQLAYDMLTLELRNNGGANYSYAQCASPVTFTATPTPTSLGGSDGKIQINPSGGSGSYQFSIDNGASWEFSIPIPISSYTFFLLSPGLYPVLVRDANRCESAVQQILVNNGPGPCNLPPVAKCKNATVQLGGSGNATVSISDVDNGSTAPCGLQLLNLSRAGFNCSDVGLVNVTLTVRDVNNNVATCTANVNVQDNQAPVARCKNATVQLNNAGSGTLTVADVDNGSTDNCSFSRNLSRTSFNCNDVGQLLSVSLTLIDPGFNVASCTASITVEDNIPPSISCPGNITVNSAPGQCSAIVSYTTPVGDDNCGSVTARTAGLASGATFPGGTTTNTFTVTAANGQTASCSFGVTVIGNQPPEITCPANLTVCSNPATNNWTGIGLDPLALNANCGSPTLTHRLNSQNFQPGDANGRSFAVGTTTVTYRATGDNNTSATCSFTVTVRKTPNASWSQSAISICNGTSINLASYARDNRNAAKRYYFYKGDANGSNLVFQGTVTASNGTVNFGQSRVVFPAGNNSTPVLHYYYVEGINTFNNGPSCPSPLSAALVVTVNPVPVLTANVSPAGQICPGNAVNISFNSSIPATVYWSNSNTGIGLAANGTGSISFNATAPGTATVFAQASAGTCGSAPISIPLTVSSCTQNRMVNAGADPFGGVGAPQLYPNPSNGQLFLRLPENNSPVLYATRIEFFDAAGRRVWSEAFELAGGAERRLDLSRLPAGVYGWTLRVGDAGYSGRIVKE